MKKIIAKKRQAPADYYVAKNSQMEVKYSAQPKMILQQQPALAKIRAIFNDINHAFFQNREEPTQDYFYLCLEDLKRQHLDYLGELPPSITYRAPYNRQGFSFKMAKKYLPCYDIHGQPILWHYCTNKPVSMLLRVMPYDFISKTTNKRCVGLTIKVSQVDLLKY